MHKYIIIYGLIIPETRKCIRSVVQDTTADEKKLENNFCRILLHG